MTIAGSKPHQLPDEKKPAAAGFYRLSHNLFCLSD